jgi:hypothetical protein
MSYADVSSRVAAIDWSTPAMKCCVVAALATPVAEARCRQSAAKIFLANDLALVTSCSSTDSEWAATPRGVVEVNLSLCPEPAL